MLRKAHLTVWSRREHVKEKVVLKEGGGKKGDVPGEHRISWGPGMKLERFLPGLVT